MFISSIIDMTNPSTALGVTLQSANSRVVILVVEKYLPLSAEKRTMGVWHIPGSIVYILLPS